MLSSKCIAPRLVFGATSLALACTGGAPHSLAAPPEEEPSTQTAEPPAPPAPVPRDPRGPLCPDCVALGGETGDFSGGGVPPADACPPYALIDADANAVSDSGVSARAAIEFLARERRVPGTWAATGAVRRPPDVQRELSGFSSQTSISIQIHVTGVKRLAWLPDTRERPAGTQADCDGFVLSADVAISTEDGALIGTFAGATVHVFSETEAELRTRADISGFTGSLELGPGLGEGLGAGLDLYLDGDRARGRLDPYVYIPPTVPNSDPSYHPLVLRWPDGDACNDYSFPYAGEEGSRRVSEAVASLAAGGRYTASYLEPRTAFANPTVLGQTEFVLDVSDPSNVCQGRSRGYYPRAPGQYYEFQLASHLYTEDGRYDLSVPLSVMARSLSDGTISYADARYYSPALPVEEFNARFGINGLDFGAAECAGLEFEFVPSSSLPLARVLFVQTGACSSTDSYGRLINGPRVEVLGR